MIDDPEDTGSTQAPWSEGPPPAPRWVKVSLVAALVLLATVLIVHLAGGGLGHMARHAQ